ncbi:MAG: hypothetical protein JNL81_13125 [Hyphomonadaceae bacterium]|nr:hypothetical protein [Hyphomonadaceae bacterium]
MRIFSRAPWILKALAVPLAATLIYAHQLYAHANHGLSLWKGGGMGMFAGLDTPGMRFVRVYVVDAAGERRPVQAFSPNERRIIQRLQTQPDNALLNALGDSVLSTPWFLSRWSVQHQTISRDRRITAGPWARTLRRADILDEAGATQSVAVASAQVEYWRLHYDGARNQLYAEMEQSVVVSR